MHTVWVGPIGHTALVLYYYIMMMVVDDDARRTTKLTIYSYSHHDDVEPQGDAVIYYCEDEVRTVIVY